VAERERSRADSSLTLEEVARLVGGELSGDAALRVRGIAPLDQASPHELALFADRRYLGQLRDTRGAAVLVSAALASDVPAGMPAVVVEDAHAALPALLGRLHPQAESPPSVHPSAVLGRGLVIGSDVTVGPYAVLEDDAWVGDRARIEAHVVVGRGSRVGEDSVLHPHVVLYPGTVLGKRVIVHAGARLGSDGFGYVLREGAYHKVPQVGRCVVHDDVEIGANSCIDRGSIGDTVVGHGSKLDNLVHLAHNVRVGAACAMAAQVGVAGSTRIGDGVVFGGQAGLVGHIAIGDGARITAQAGVIGDVDPGATVTGYPARRLKEYLKGAALALRLPEILERVRALEQRVGAPGTGAGERAATPLD
jgi:UDP-3-O-[3-hydroxymyristoyl] glucosamine N-acyltransferase